jgi:GH24 family phage-related lysozyme (muramidase)
MIQIGFYRQRNLIRFKQLATRIKKNEGFKRSIYKDVLGNPTIGYGHLVVSLDKFENKKRYSKRILTKVFNQDLNDAILKFKKNYNSKSLPNNVKEVIIEMIFQLGINNTLKFVRFKTNIEKKLYFLAAFELIKSRWYKQTPKRVEGLINILLRS